MCPQAILSTRKLTSPEDPLETHLFILALHLAFSLAVLPWLPTPFYISLKSQILVNQGTFCLDGMRFRTLCLRLG